jgi:putative tricarboxylic transport membrane protein
MDYLVPALKLVLQPDTLLAVLLASFFGFIVGALPGLTATMAVALLVPITFLLSPLAAIASIVAASAMAMFAGDIPGALLRIPGTPASAAYVEESYKLTLAGRGGYVLGVNAACSMIGGVIGTVVLILAAPMLANVALNFSAFEFFWLSFLGLSCGAFVAGDRPIKGTLAMLIGLLIATVGMDYSSGHARFTFGNTNLLEGISFIPALIGMFAMPEILRSMLKGASALSASGAPVTDDWKGAFRSIFQYRRVVLRSSALGTGIGILPGAGADIAAWIAFAVAKRLSKTPKQWGTGHVEGVIAGSSANNAALGGAWIPALVFAIPGDTITAIAIGVLYLKGMNPGPAVFINNADLLYAVFLVFLLANLLLLPFGWIAIRLAKVVLGIPRDLLMPALLILAVVGAFAIDNDFSGVWIMLALGIAAYVLEECGYPIAPIVLGIVLGKIVEQNLIQALTSTQGSLIGFFERPVSAVLGVITILVWVYAGSRWARGLLARGRIAASGSSR